MALDAINPRDEAELADAIRSANGPLAIQGAGTRGGQTNGSVLSTVALSGISLYEPGAMTMVAGAGTPLADIEHELASQGQRLAFEPMDHRVLLGTTGAPTLGGVYATNTSGPRRIQAGAMRDFALGVRFVDGMGTVVKNGGRVMKNVTGYDLVKMLAGSRGALGVVTEVSLKVQPATETMATVTVHVSDPTQGVAALSAALGSPFDVSGAAFSNGQALVRVEGFAQSVAYRVEQLKIHLATYGEISVSDDAALWSDIRDVRAFANGKGDVWKISVKPTDGPQVVAALPGDAMMDWGGGLVWAQVPAGTDVRRILADIAGHATCVRGKGRGPALPPADATLAAITVGLKSKFDPRSILNPGVMV
ncbi:MAG: FAD-binding protein [Pseudomonadota bacterium]